MFCLVNPGLNAPFNIENFRIPELPGKHLQVRNMFKEWRYLRMDKQQFFNTTQNLLIKSHIHEIMCVQFFNFLTWFEVDTYTIDNSWQLQVIGDIKWRKWLFWKRFLAFKLHTNYETKMVTSFIIALLSRAIIGPNFKFQRGDTTHPFPHVSSTNHICLKSSTYGGLIFTQLVETEEPKLKFC